MAATEYVLVLMGGPCDGDEIKYARKDTVPAWIDGTPPGWTQHAALKQARYRLRSSTPDEKGRFMYDFSGASKVSH